jgi:hypothetical protein
MPAAFVRLTLLTGVLSLSACTTGTFLDDVGTIWDDGATTEQQEQEAAQQARVLAKVPVQAVRSVEMGRTRDGFLITAFGTAPGLGYSLATLRPRRKGEPGADGYIEYDFVAVEPPEEFNLPPGSTQARAMRADLPVELSRLQGALGIRVLALSGGVQMEF